MNDPSKKEENGVLTTTEAVSRSIDVLLDTPALKSLCSALLAAGDLYLVGGAIRNLFESQAVGDLDFATSLPPDDLAGVLTRANIRTVATGWRHGTLTAVLPEGDIEITSFRNACGDGTTTLGDSIEKDLQARDFTINAIAYDIRSRTLLDPHGGQADLAKGVVRAVGQGDLRLQEDPLRLLRMIRFGPSEGRRIDSATSGAARKLAPLLSRIAVERVREELERILLAPNPGEALHTMRDTGLLHPSLPELAACVGFEQNEFHVEDVFTHTASVVQRAAAQSIVCWAALFHDTGKPSTLSVGDDGRRHFYNHEQESERLADAAMRRLRFSRETSRAIKTLVRTHMRPIECGPAGVRRLMRDLGPLLDEWLMLKRADKPPLMPEHVYDEREAHFLEMLTAEQTRLAQSTQKTLAINGRDLMKLGVAEGPLIGEILSALEQLTLDDPALNTQEHLLQHARKLIQASQDA